MWLLFSLCLLFLIISTLVGISDNEASWEIRECITQTMGRFVICEEEDGKYYYTLFGRLILESNKLINKRYSDESTGTYILRDIRVYGFADLKCYPKFSTKKRHRDSILSKLGI